MGLLRIEAWLPANVGRGGRSRQPTPSPRIEPHGHWGPARTRSTSLDNLTHALVGAAISKSGAERVTPLATATLVLAANAPDIDMLSYARGEYYALAFRRGVTHGLPAMLVLPFVVAGLVLTWDRWVRRRRDPLADPARAGPVLALSAAGLLTHPTLDWMNTYGMRWGLPLDGSWTYGDALFIIDPWIWLPLGGSVFLASRPGRAGLLGWSVVAVLTSALVLLVLGAVAGVVWTAGVAAVLAVRLRLGAPEPPSGRAREVRASDRARELRAPSRQRLVRAAGAATVVYIAGMIASDHFAARHVARLAEAAGMQVRDVMVAPARGNPFAAHVEVLTADAYVPGVHHWLREPRVELFPDRALPLLSGSAVALAAPSAAGADTIAAADTITAAPAAARAPGTALPPGTLDAADIVAAARRAPSVRNYLVWSRFPYVRIEPEGEGWRVRFGDARYDDEPGAGGLGGLSVHVQRPRGP